MLNNLIQQYGTQIQNFSYLILIINALLHFIFASAVARDAGTIYRLGQRPVLVSAPTWAFATLIGGVFTATIYWILHHSTLTRPTMRETRYERA
jgi:uncharacterized membrane protein